MNVDVFEEMLAKKTVSYNWRKEEFKRAHTSVKAALVTTTIRS